MWIKLAALAVSAAVAFGAGWTAQGWRWDADVEKLKAAHATALTAARNDEKGKCRARQKITKEVSNVYQNKARAGDAARANALRSVRADPAKQCVTVSTAGAAGGDHAATTDGVSGQAVIAAESLINDAALADRQAAQLEACQDYVNRLLKAQEAGDL